MYTTHRTARGILIAEGLALTIFISAASGQARQGKAPREANFFIGTPAGWVQPKTPWGDPDLQGIWPISYVGSVPLERCAGGGGRGGPSPCDTHKTFLTEEEYTARVDAAARQVDRFADAVKQGEGGRAFLAGVTDVTVPQRQLPSLWIRRMAVFPS
jgi:hypothetical protein